MKVVEARDMRIGVFSVGRAAAGARTKIGFQRAIDAGLDAIAVVPPSEVAQAELPAAMIEALAREHSDMVVHAGCRAYRTSFLRRVPFWDNTDERHFDEQLLLQAAAVGASVVETAPPAHAFTDRLSGLRARARYVLHGKGILYSRNFDLAASGRK